MRTAARPPLAGPSEGRTVRLPGRSRSGAGTRARSSISPAPQHLEWTRRRCPYPLSRAPTQGGPASSARPAWPIPLTDAHTHGARRSPSADPPNPIGIGGGGRFGGLPSLPGLDPNMAQGITGRREWRRRTDHYHRGCDTRIRVDRTASAYEPLRPRSCTNTFAPVLRAAGYTKSGRTYRLVAPNGYQARVGFETHIVHPDQVRFAMTYGVALAPLEGWLLRIADPRRSAQSAKTWR